MENPRDSLPLSSSIKSKKDDLPSLHQKKSLVIESNLININTLKEAEVEREKKEEEESKEKMKQ